MYTNKFAKCTIVHTQAKKWNTSNAYFWQKSKCALDSISGYKCTFYSDPFNTALQLENIYSNPSQKECEQTGPVQMNFFFQLSCLSSPSLFNPWSLFSSSMFSSSLSSNCKKSKKTFEFSALNPQYKNHLDFSILEASLWARAPPPSWSPTAPPSQQAAQTAPWKDPINCWKYTTQVQ